MNDFSAPPLPQYAESGRVFYRPKTYSLGRLACPAFVELRLPMPALAAGTRTRISRQPHQGTAQFDGSISPGSMEP